MTAVGAIMWMKNMAVGGMHPGPVLFGPASSASSTPCSRGGADVTKEAEYGGYHTRVVQISHRYGMIMFIASEVMFFVAWFWAYFDVEHLSPARPSNFARYDVLGGQWPPKGIDVFDPFHLPLLNTLILLTSGTTVTWAHHALLHNDREGVKWGLILTVMLGALFTTVQAYEYSHAAFAFKGNIYGSPSSWRRASTASTCSSARSSCWSASSAR